MQGVVFHGHWLGYFDDASTHFFARVRAAPATEVFSDFDVMVVKAALEWQGPARFGDEVTITVEPTRIGTASFDLTYTATVDGRATCTGTVTYVSVTPGTHTSTPIPPGMRASLEAAHRR